MRIKIYVISLKRKKERRVQIHNFLTTIDGNIPFEIVDAVDGKDLGNCEIPFQLSKIYRNPYTNVVMTVGEIGCALSHYSVWKKAMDEGVQYPIILEDDVIITNRFNQVINDIIDKEIEFDIMYLSRKLVDGESDEPYPGDPDNYVKCGYSYWLNAYMLTNKSTGKLVHSGFLDKLIVVDDFIPMLYTRSYSRYLSFDDYNIESFIGLSVKSHIVLPTVDAFETSETESQPFYELEYDNDFYQDTLQLVTVGTDPVDGYKRFVESANIYGVPFVCLGFGQPWGGNDMTRGPGGGHKVVLFKKYLEQFPDDDERFIIFSDCYDAVVSGSPDQMITKFLQIRQNTGCDVMFSAEAILWPDESIADQFPEVGTPYRYLNSGGFIGTIKALKILTREHIESSDDDQYYYQQEYIKSCRGESDINIILDDYAFIFQTLSSHFDHITIDYQKSKVNNDLTKSSPLMIHGNGGDDSKQFLNHLCNYINMKNRTIYGYKDTHTDSKKLESLNYHDYPTIYIWLIVDNINLIHNINDLRKQKYPRSQTEFDIEFSKDTNELKNKFISILNKRYDYVFIGNISHTITDKFAFEKLICSNLDIVGVDDRCEWCLNVPYIDGSVMISSNKFDTIKQTMIKHEINENESFNEYICRAIRISYNFMYTLSIV